MNRAVRPPGQWMTSTVRTLATQRMSAAALDVLSTGPSPADNPLLTAKNCLITPHNAWAMRAVRARLMKTTIENVRAYLAGQPQNVVGGR